MARRKNNLPHDVEERAQDDLLATLERIDKIKEEKAAVTKAIRAIEDEEWTRVRLDRDLLEGRVSEQVALPGLEEPVTERDRRIGAALRKAIDSLERITGVKADVEDFSEDARPGALTRAIVAVEKARDRFTKDGATVELRLAASAPLVWHDESDGRHIGVAGDGLVYAIEPFMDGFRWTQGRKKGPGLATRPDVKRDAERAELERQADRKLRNAGDGALTQSDTKGPATTSKKGRR